MIEPRAAAWSARRASDSERRSIQEIVQAMAETLEAGDPVAAFLESDRRFHAAIAEASKNLVLSAVMRTLHNVVTTSWVKSMIGREDLETLLAQHTAIGEAIKAGAEAKAARAMEAHLRWAMRRELAGVDGLVGRPSRRRARSVRA